MSDMAESYYEIPSILYRFRSCNTQYFEAELARLIGNSEHFYSAVEFQNDPFDCNPVIEKSSDKDVFQFYQSIRKRFIVSEEALRESFPEESTSSIKSRLRRDF